MRYELIETPSTKESSELVARFQEFLAAAGMPDESEDRVFVIQARDEADRLVAGILATVYWNGLEIDTLWVDERHRGKGLGAGLLDRAERFGKAHGAVIAYLKTVDAKYFYENCGYEVFGILEDRPIGSLLYHMKKRLDDR